VRYLYLFLIFCWVSIPFFFTENCPSDRSLACGREERNLLALYLKERKEKIDIALPGRSKCTFVTEVSREEITLNGLPVLLSPLQKGRSDSLIGEDLIKRRIRSFI